MSTPRLDRLVLSLRRHYPWRFAALVFCTSYAASSLALDLSDLLRSRTADRSVTFWMPVCLTIGLFWSTGRRLRRPVASAETSATSNTSPVWGSGENADQH